MRADRFVSYISRFTSIQPNYDDGKIKACDLVVSEVEILQAFGKITVCQMRALLDYSEFMEAKKNILDPAVVHPVYSKFISLLTL